VQLGSRDGEDEEGALVYQEFPSHPHASTQELRLLEYLNNALECEFNQLEIIIDESKLQYLMKEIVRLSKIFHRKEKIFVIFNTLKLRCMTLSPFINQCTLSNEKTKSVNWILMNRLLDINLIYWVGGEKMNFLP
jgi:hypothetical protein